MIPRIFVVGTGTGVGKTSLTCALLLQARALGRRPLPFKPAQSGSPPGDPGSDVARLLRAAALPPELADFVAPLRYDPPLAPGLADSPDRFFRSAAPDLSPLRVVQTRLQVAIDQTQPDLVFVEGAGGFHVPMPGGSWLPEWIAALGTHCIVVGTSGLGTINHTLLTIDAVRALECPLLGFYLVDVDQLADPSRSYNAAVIEQARGVPHLGTLPHLSLLDSSPATDLVQPLLARLPG